MLNEVAKAVPWLIGGSADLSPSTLTRLGPPSDKGDNPFGDFGPDVVHTWSFGVERELSKNSAIEARYVGNHGINLFQTVDGNPYFGTVGTTTEAPVGKSPLLDE